MTIICDSDCSSGWSRGRRVLNSSLVMKPMNELRRRIAHRQPAVATHEHQENVPHVKQETQLLLTGRAQHHITVLPIEYDSSSN